ncbi:MAG: CatB-related O-acetyltransferase [Pseudomonas sp.]|nr:MAG: CatB-related O-acetyltransferase [Pseudomonas sp.]
MERYIPFKGLREKGLRVTAGLDTRGKDVKVSFEKPCQVNNAPMFLYKNISLGMYTYLRTGTIRHVSSIGRYCSIGPNVVLGEGEHPTSWLSTSPAQYYPDQFSWFPGEKALAQKRRLARTVSNDDGARGDIEIGLDVWIGGGVTIRRGVKIGSGAIIGGGAFVTKDVEPYSIVAGLPAKHVRYRFSREIIERLLALQWWVFDINDLAGISFDKVEKAAKEIELRRDRGLIIPKREVFDEAFINSKGYHSFRLGG